MCFYTTTVGVEEVFLKLVHDFAACGRAPVGTKEKRRRPIWEVPFG